jgi:hypothetical protein
MISPMMTQMCHLPYRTLFQKQDLESFFMQTIDTKIQANDLGKKKKKNATSQAKSFQELKFWH